MPRLGPHQSPCARTAIDREELRRLRAEVIDLKLSVIAFCAPWAVEHAHHFGWPRGHLHPTHYDILARAGARMDDFIRHNPE